jgi:hypothetical protein
MLLFWIVSYIDDALVGIVFVAIVVALPIGLLVAHDWLKHNFYDTERSENIRLERFLTENWRLVEKEIRLKLSRQLWMDKYDLEKFRIMWGITENDINHILAKFAIENSATTEYGVVYSQDDGKRISGNDYVLIDIKNLPKDKYYYG